MSRPRVFRDPIHGLISIDPGDEFLLALIDTPEFQRLRRVRQLGVSHLTYPGAEHTRFNHSMGVFHVAQRMLEVLERRHGKDNMIGRLIAEHGRSVKAAALLHDTGHGAFSHLMERAFPDTAEHEERSQRMISGSGSTIPSLLKKHGLQASTVADIVGKRFSHRFLQDIVSSSLDADRMDYLLRDAHFTGVRYGIYDLEWLVNSLCLGTLKPDDGEVEGLLRLSLDYKRGLHSAEQLLMARQHMSVQVYFHKSTRRWEAHLLCLFREAARLAKDDKLPVGTFPMVNDYFAKEGGVEDSLFLQIDEPCIIGCFSLWAQSTKAQHKLIALLSRAYLNRAKIFKMKELEPGAATEAQWRAALEGLGAKWRNSWELDYIQFTAYKMPKDGEREANPEDYFQKIATNAVLLSHGGPEDAAMPVQDESPIFRTLGGPEQPKFLRLYFLPELERSIVKIDKKLNQR
jgi:HD superfamily phosphohydrolase